MSWNLHQHLGLNTRVLYTSFHPYPLSEEIYEHKPSFLTSKNESTTK